MNEAENRATGGRGVKARHETTVDYVQHMGSDEMVARSARVSTGKDQLEQTKIRGLIGYLMRERHTSPLEHNVLTVRVEAPIFVAREWMRHRTQSYSELSFRFSEAGPTFYVPGEARPLVNEGSGAHPKLTGPGGGLWDRTRDHHLAAYELCWQAYERMLADGVATEVARNVLPVGIFTSFYATANLGNWFRFLVLRSGRVGAPQAEIVEAAGRVEEIISGLWPVTYGAWRETL